MKNFFFGGKKKGGKEGKRTTPITGDSTVYLTGDERVDSAKIKTLLDTMAELISSQDPVSLLESIVDRSIRLVGAERGVLFLKDENESMTIKIARDASGNELKGDIQYSTGVVNKVVSTGEPVLLKVGATEITDLSQSVVDLKLRAVMCVTLSVKNNILGVIYVDSRAASREFKRSDLRFFDALANALAITIENARLVADYVEAERIKESLEIARRIQEQLLPKDPAGLRGFDIAGKLVPVEATAGDYYDFIYKPGERLDVVVGDVTGHGIGPAILMSSVRAMLRGLISIESGLSTVLEYLNDQMDRDTEADMFMSLFVGSFDLRERTLIWGSAGHVPQLIYRAGTDTFIECRRTGVALGIEAGIKYKEAEKIQLEPGDFLTLYTDGITETRSGQEMFGLERLKSLLHSRRHLPAREILSGILEEVKTFGAGRAVDDDLTLVVARVTD